MARAMLFDAEHGFSHASAFSGTNWNWVVLVNPTRAQVITHDRMFDCIRKPPGSS